MAEILYHGSENIIEKPEYGRGAKNNDYGRGFYCTRSGELAKEWACKNNNDGFVNTYEIDMAGLNIIDLNGEGFHILNWLAVLAENRTYWQSGSIAAEAKEYIKKEFMPDISGADIMIGNRADDSYFSFAQDFVSGAISLGKLSKAMHLGELGEQVVLISPEAFERIRFKESEKVKAEIYYPKKVGRDYSARKEYRKSKKDAASLTDEIYMIDILREEIKNNDPRLL